MAAMFDILIFSIGSLSQNKRLPLYKLNADGDNIDSTKKTNKKTPKKQHSHDQSIIIHREISFFFYSYEGYY